MSQKDYKIQIVEALLKKENYQEGLQRTQYQPDHYCQKNQGIISRKCCRF